MDVRQRPHDNHLCTKENGDNPLKGKTKGLHCPACGKRPFKTIDSRPTRAGVRRRKECVSCSYRMTTIETMVAGKVRIWKA
ncbi:hypothetical protein [Nitratireductor arenosus]|uniref:NrdR family transcriptional regulator n=1 Tax=Nitratireductor arenosus TaxID=2682096 RepID=UPI003CCD5838